jgi:hypothetical protein
MTTSGLVVGAETGAAVASESEIREAGAGSDPAPVGEGDLITFLARG